MIVDQIEASMERLDLSLSIKNANEFKADLEALYTKLVKYELKILTYMNNTIETQKALGITTEEKNKIVNTLKRFCKDSLEGKRNYALEELQNLENEINAGNKELKILWSNYRDKNFSSRKNLIVALSSMLEGEQQLDKLGELRSRIEANPIGNQQTVKDIENFCKLTDELIKRRKMEPDVQEFIQQLALGKEILLCQITDSILTWIKENGMEKKIVLALKS